MRWHDDRNKVAFELCVKKLQERGYAEEDIREMHIRKLSAKKLRTDSKKMQELIQYAFFVGQLDGIRLCDKMTADIRPS